MKHCFKDWSQSSSQYKVTKIIALPGMHTCPVHLRQVYSVFTRGMYQINYEVIVFHVNLLI